MITSAKLPRIEKRKRSARKEQGCGHAQLAPLLAIAQTGQSMQPSGPTAQVGPHSFLEGAMTHHRVERHRRSLVKAVSWRLTGTLDTFIISFIVTGHFKIAGSIAATELLTKIGLYYLHERAW